MADDEQISIPIIWVGVEDAEVMMSNQLISQFEPGMFFLTFGHVTPPVLLGSPEQRAEQAERLGYVPVKTLGRFAITPRRLREFITVLQDNLRTYEEQVGEG